MAIQSLIMAIRLVEIRLVVVRLVVILLVVNRLVVTRLVVIRQAIKEVEQLIPEQIREGIHKVPEMVILVMLIQTIRIQKI